MVNVLLIINFWTKHSKYSQLGPQSDSIFQNVVHQIILFNFIEIGKIYSKIDVFVRIYWLQSF